MKTKQGRSGGTKRDGGVDREKLKVAARRLHRRTLFEVLDRAIEAVPQARLAGIAAGYIHLGDLRPSKSFLAEVKSFCKASLEGRYYETFEVNWRNSNEKSGGTEAWIAECRRLFERCISGARKADPAETRAALALLLDMLRRVDDGGDEIVFWADEGGSYEVYVDWKKVMPVWFRCLAATAGPEEYAREACRAIKDFDEYDRDRHLKQARAAASPEQRQALKAIS